MDAKKKKKIVIWVSLTMLLGVGGYFAYTKLIKPKLDQKKAERLEKEAANNTPAPSSNSAPSGNTLPPIGESPLFPDDLLKFQKYVLTKDTKILAPYGADGKWGRASYNAYQKYYKDWKASLGGSAPKPNANPLFNKGVYTRGLFVDIFNSPDVLSITGYTVISSGEYVGRYISETINGIGTEFIKVFKDGEYKYIRKSQATIK